MLKLLTIDNLALIDRLEIELEAGLNVLTGETGSGKSIIIDAVELLLGGRASQDLIRTGADRAFVQGVFEVEGNAPLIDLLNESGIDAGEDEVIVRREVSSTGRSRVFVNNQAATASLLRTLQPLLVDIHGQGDQQSLLVPSNHTPLLDGYAATGDLRSAVAQTYERIDQRLDELDALRSNESARLQELDIIAFQAAEIERAGIKPNEDVDLENERAVLANGERILRLCGESFSQLYDDEQAVLSVLAAVDRRFVELAEIDTRFLPLVEQLTSSRFAVEEIAFFLRSYIDNIQVSPERLEAIQDRLSELDRLKRKYGGSLDEVESAAARLRSRLDELQHSEQKIAGLLTELGTLLEQYATDAARLTEKRATQAREFEKAVLGEFEAVALEKARFEVRFRSSEAPATIERLRHWFPGKPPNTPLSRSGQETAEFFFSANPGEELKPLSGVASGGELSRVMLVIKNVTAPTLFPRTLIFDEIDAGIGGRVADAVGLRLKRLAGSNQVLCVTHQAQIARYADAHLLVSKEVTDARTKTRVVELTRDGRVEELARMLGGAQVTVLAKKHARELLKLTERDEVRS